MSSSETAKYRHLTAKYCQETPGVDIGSSGDPVVPHAIQIDLDTPYCPLLGVGPIHVKGDGAKISQWFKASSLAFVYSSHLLEDYDFHSQKAVMLDWMSRVRVNGHLIILMPDAMRWRAALGRGQPPNLAHRHEGTPGELSQMLESAATFNGQYWGVIMDECPDPNDYGIVFIARRLS